MTDKFYQIIEGLVENSVASPEDLTLVLSEENEDKLAYLFQQADCCTRLYKKNIVDIRAIIECSNYCRCACAYCGLTRDNQTLTRYRMTIAEILATVADVAAAGYQTVIIQSGEDLYYSQAVIGSLITTIKEHYQLAVTLSLGERSYAEYLSWHQLGADRYLIKHETADEDLYNQYHPHSSFAQRVECQRQIKQIGYELGGGFMVGLPGQTHKTLALDLLHLQQMKTDMAGIGPYIAHNQTVLKGSPDGDSHLTLKVLALARLLMPAINLPSTTALNVKGGLADALNCGANVIMQKATPEKYRNLYDIYPGREGQCQPLAVQRQELLQSLAKVGKIGV